MGASRETENRNLIGELAALLEGETNRIANLANASALINQHLDRINWVGFYLKAEDGLMLGPFQGLPACVRIPEGKGVCGTAAALKRTVVVDDVHAFPGHIACDPASRSEIVVPMVKDGEVVGVLDVDSPEPARFGEKEKEMLEKAVDVIMAHWQ
jgi:GAF domain-containing protein